MSALIILRFLALAVPPVLLLLGTKRYEAPHRLAHTDVACRLPVMVNFAALCLFFAFLILFQDSFPQPLILSFALGGLLLAIGGATVVIISRAALGSAWSIVPRATRATGLVTKGAYRFVRHPIYLGFTILSVGLALAFASWPALALTLCAIIPSFVWRAHVEERLLDDMFGEHYVVYRQRTKMIIPFVL